MNRTPISLSLFPEYLEDDSDEMSAFSPSFPSDPPFPSCRVSSSITAQRFFRRMLAEMRGNFDPELLGRSNYVHIGPEAWPSATREKVVSSFARYRHYLTSDLIRPEDIAKYRREWMVNAFNLVPESLLRYEESARRVFQVIIPFKSLKYH